MKKHLEARNTLYKLAQHPALPETIFSILQLMSIDIVQVCKNRHTKPHRGLVQVYYTPANYKKYRQEFDNEFKEYTKEELEKELLFVRADVPYKKIYGEHWTPDHIEYWGELSFVLFTGKDFGKWHDPHNWTHCSGVSASGRSFEDMVVLLGKKFFSAHGKFDSEDFLTTAEKENHEKEEVFFTKPHKNGSELVSNPKYKSVYAAELNRRWVKWFSTTEYGKKQWGSTLRDVLQGREVR
jgi:hypothetical protein